MLKSAKLSAEEKFAALQKQEVQARTEKDIAEQAKVEKRARLRALRLTKEAADEKSAIKAADKKSTVKAADKKSTVKAADKKSAVKAAR